MSRFISFRFKKSQLYGDIINYLLSRNLGDVKNNLVDYLYGLIDYFGSKDIKISFLKNFESDTFALIFYTVILVERLSEPLSVITTLILDWKHLFQ